MARAEKKLTYSEARKIFADYRKRNAIVYNYNKTELEKAWFNYIGELWYRGIITLKERKEWISRARFK
jgi:hypothetical protein